MVHIKKTLKFICSICEIDFILWYSNIPYYSNKQLKRFQTSNKKFDALYRLINNNNNNEMEELSIKPSSGLTYQQKYATIILNVIHPTGQQPVCCK